MRRVLVSGVLALVVGLAALGPSLAYAAPAEQACAANAYRQHDMAGIYVSPESQMRVQVYACGGIYVQWDNAYGTHTAAYGSVGRLHDGTIAADSLPNMGAPLDGSRRIGVKPAEVGYIQAVTFGTYDDSIRIYRLKKIA